MRIARRSILVAMLTAIGVMASTAFAQFRLPEPLPFGSVAEAIRTSAGPLDSATWDRIEAAYITYLDRAERFRFEDDLSPISEDRVRGMWQSGPAARAAMRAFSGFEERWRTADRELVESVIAVLPVELSQAPESLRRWYERYELDASGTFANSCDGSRIARRLRAARVPPSDRALIDEACDELERSLVGKERRRRDMTPDVWIASIEARSTLPPRPSHWDEEAIQEWHRQRSELMRETWRPLFDIDAQIGSDIDHWFDRLLPRLSVNAARAAMLAYGSGRFDPLDGISEATDLRQLRRMLADRTVEEGPRQVALERVAAWRRKDDAIIRRMLALAREGDALRRRDMWQTPTMDDGSRNHWVVKQELDAIGQARQQELDELHSAVEKSLGVEMQVETEVEVRSLAHDDQGGLLFAVSIEEFIADRTDDEDEGEHSHAASNYISSGSWVHSPISLDDVARMVVRLKLDAGDRATLESLHSDLLSAWRGEIEPQMQQVIEWQSRPYYREDGTVDMAIPARITAAWNELIKSVHRLNDDFFAAATAALPERSRDALAAWKLRHCLGPTTAMNEGREQFVEGSPNPNRYANIAAAVEDSEIPDGDRSTAETVLAAHLAAGDRTVLDARDALDREEILIVQASRESHGRWQLAANSRADPQTDPAFLASQQRVEEMSVRSQAAAAVVAEANVRLMSDLAVALPQSSWRIIRLHYRRTLARIDESEDRRCEQTLRYAQAAPSLDDAKRARLEKIHADWRARRDREWERLGELGRAPIAASGEGVGIGPSGAPLRGHEWGTRTSWSHFRANAANEIMRDAVARLLTPDERLGIRELATLLPLP